MYASDGAETLEQIKKHKNDLALVLLDLQMPRMGGMEVLKVMKEEDELRGIPVIVMTADQSAEVDCLKIGAIDFIPKPYPSFEIIQARVKRCIELSEKSNIIQSTERDSLTNLLNLDYFLRYVRMYDQHYTDMQMDAIVLDVNHFHMLNERYGKQYGDSVLARIGKRIRKISREVGGVGCRRAADTFFIYCPTWTITRASWTRRPRVLWTGMCLRTASACAWACILMWTSPSKSNGALTMRRSPRTR